MVATIARWGTQFEVSTGASTPVTPRVAAIGPFPRGGGGFVTGRFVVVWAQQSDVHGLGDASAIVAQLCNGDGSSLHGPFLVNSTIGDIQTTPDVTECDGDDGFAVVWRDSSRVFSGFGTDIRMRLFDADGAAAASSAAPALPDSESSSPASAGDRASAPDKRRYPPAPELPVPADRPTAAAPTTATPCILKEQLQWHM